MKYIPASVFNRLTLDEKSKLWSYCNFIGVHVPILVSSRTSDIGDAVSILLGDTIQFAVARKHHINLSYEEIQILISLQISE